MALACQKNSYVQSFDTVVKSCTPVSSSKEEITGYNIILVDTILFPEGGGQPDDRGTINDIEVKSVQLVNNEAVHLTHQPIDPETTVEVKVDWERRFDHMQQHTGQHLITAVIQKKYGFKTLSWWLGRDVCKIELSTPELTACQMDDVEEICNSHIREQIKVYPVYYDSVDDPQLQDVRSGGLPDNITGPIRVVKIEGIDENLCCGTHLRNLSDLQMIKLVGIEKGKKGTTNLLFLAGGRVSKALDKSLKLETNINSLLKGSPEDFPKLISKLQTSYKEANKNASNLLKEICELDTIKLTERISTIPDPFISFHRKEAEPGYLSSLLQRLPVPEDWFILLTGGNDKGSGCFIMSGPEDTMNKLVPEILSIIDGKGACKKGRLQGKANKLSQKHKIEKLIKS